MKTQGDSDMLKYLVKYPHLAGGMMAVIALAAVFVALPGYLYHG